MLLSRNSKINRYFYYLAVFALLCVQAIVSAAVAGTASMYKTGFVDQEKDIPRVHAPSLVELNGALVVTWYAGSREGAQDVAIYLSAHDRNAGKWGADRKIFDRDSLQKSLNRYIKKLGNPVLGVDSKNRLWLYFVSVSAGGWSGSAINYSVSSDQGQTWSIPKRLVTSPFFNVSTLVRTQPFNFADGTIGLPVYHELLGKFGELLRFDGDGNVLAKHRITSGAGSLQPAIVDLGKNRLLALMRNADSDSPGVLLSRSENNGKNWSETETLQLPNTDSSVAAIRDNRNRILLVFNNTNSNRNILSLAVSSDDGNSWKVLQDFENSKQIHDEYSYPSLLQDVNGTYHLVYTWLRKRIKHVQFNEAWLMQKLKAGGEQ